MGYDILRNFERARRKEREQEYALERIRAAQAPQRAAAKAARIEAFDRWNLREKPGPIGAEVFYDKGPDKLTTVVPYSDKYPYHGAERAEAVRRAKRGATPREPAAIEKTRAEAAEIRYGTKFKRGLEDVLAGSVKAYERRASTEAEEAGLGVSEERRRIRRRDEAETIARIEAEEVEVEAAKPPAPAVPGRKIRPSLKRFLWEGRPEIGRPGLLAPIKGYSDIAKLLGEAGEEAYKWAFPRTK